MTTSKSHFEQLLSKIYAKSFCKNNQKVCIDCLKQIKINLSVKIVVALNFICLIIKTFHLKYWPVCNILNGSIVKN